MPHDTTWLTDQRPYPHTVEAYITDAVRKAWEAGARHEPSAICTEITEDTMRTLQKAWPSAFHGQPMDRDSVWRLQRGTEPPLIEVSRSDAGKEVPQ